MKHVAVYCGSSSGNKEIYSEAARSLGRALISSNKKMVYGAGSVGLMGIIADEMLSLKGEVIGIIPQFLMDKEVGHRHLTRLEITKDMHSRKMRMADLSDAFIAMPGGFGTLDELFEILTWGQLNLHSKPVGIYNINGYFDGILSFLQKAVEDGFLKARYVDRIIVEEDASALLQGMEAYSSGPVQEGKWL